ncbi:MAG: ABC transporter substrate-binding protein [Ruminococcus flavefaciens]|nr:ABC transporter substrate-binding protein [Ruminococcus flavefaciens]
MIKRIKLIFSALVIGTVLIFTGCGDSAVSEKDKPLSWGNWNHYSNYEDIWNLIEETYPDMQLEYVPYSGANMTGYAWAQMRADDTADIFTSKLIVDESLAKERLIDLSGYDFISDLSTSLLDQISIDGGIYMIPTVTSIYGILYNKTLMEEYGWEVPQNMSELESLCAEIREEGLIPGVIGTQLTGGPFAAVFNIAKTDWLTTPEGIQWEQDFLAGKATAEGFWENTTKQVQRYIDMGMFTTDPEDRSNDELIHEYLGERKAVFFTMASTFPSDTLPNGDKLGMMPYISEDGSKNIYMYSTSNYFGISKRLAESGNEEKLKDAINILSLMYSQKGQECFTGENAPYAMTVRESSSLPEDSMIYDAQQAMKEGRAFPMTYVHWENVLADMGQSFKEWLRGENNMDGTKCISRMDELQSSYLSDKTDIYFCESTADFTLEQTAVLVGKALGSATGADVAMIPVDEFHEGTELYSGVSGKLYKEPINSEISNNIAPSYDGEYALMTMTGAEIKSLAKQGFDLAGDGKCFQYIYTAKGGKIDDDVSYKVVFPMNAYTEQTAEKYNAVVEKGSLREYLREWFKEQKTVSPDGNKWE